MTDLKSILEQGYVDPEFVTELDDEEKQVLFYAIREEQKRRYYEAEEDYKKKDKEKLRKNHKSKKKNVKFLQGTDKNVWVWVMGDHKNDKSIEQILEEEALAKAEKKAEEEIAKLRKVEEDALAKLSANQQKMEDKKRKKLQLKVIDENDEMTDDEYEKVVQKYQKERHTRRESIKQIERNKTRRASQIFDNMKELRLKQDEEARRMQKEIEETWKKQEEKAKRLETKMQKAARKARNDGRLGGRHNSIIGTQGELTKIVDAFRRSSVDLSQMSLGNLDILNTKTWKTGERKNKQEIIKWYKEKELPNGAGLNSKTKHIANWFHGPISRKETEDLLEECKQGTYMVRLSSHDFGYTISYRAEEKCKHAYITVTDNKYKILELLGSNHRNHKSLEDLVQFYKNHPVQGH